MTADNGLTAAAVEALALAAEAGAAESAVRTARETLRALVEWHRAVSARLAAAEKRLAEESPGAPPGDTTPVYAFAKGA